MDWFDLLAVQGTLKSLLQHHNKLLVYFYRAVYIVTKTKSHTQTMADGVWVHLLSHS